MSQAQMLARKLLDILGVTNSVDDLFKRLQNTATDRNQLELFQKIIKKEECLEMLENMLFDIYNKEEIAYSVAIYSTDLGQRILKKEHGFMKEGREVVLQYVKNRFALFMEGVEDARRKNR